MKPHHTHSSGTNPELCTSTKVQSVSRSIMSDSLWTPWAVAHQESCVGFVVFLDAILIRKPCSKVMFKGIQAAAGPGPPRNSPPPPPSWGFPGDTSGKEPTCQCRRLGDNGSLGREDPLEEDMAAHSIILAWCIPWREEPGGLQSIGSHRVRHDRSDVARMHAPPSSAVSTPPPCKCPSQVRRVEHTTQDCSGLSPPPCLPTGCPLLMRPIL